MTVYVFDSGPLIDLFSHYYRERFPSLWSHFDQMVDEGRITSTREVYNELDGWGDSLSAWANQNKQLFPIPSEKELEFVMRIFDVAHFQAMIRKNERMRGKPVADPFVIARSASVEDACLVTTEKPSPNSAKVPIVCQHFGIDCTDLQGFMERENWRF